MRETNCETVDDSKILKELIDKQTPKKPDITKIDNLCYCDCGNLLGDDDYLFKLRVKYCYSCGCPLDWSKDE
jgi:hypothetical protein